MDTALELETKKLVKAWVIGTDSSYIQPEKDVFIANKDEIINYEKTLKENNLEYIEVRYKKSHIRKLNNNLLVRVEPHFFILNKSKLGIETLPESPEHKKIKSFIYNTFFNNEDLELSYSEYRKKSDIIYNKVKLKDLDIEWEDFSLKKEDFFI